MVRELSGLTVNFPGLEAFSVMALRVVRFVKVAVTGPVAGKVIDPSAVLSSFLNSLAAGTVSST